MTAHLDGGDAERARYLENERAKLRNLGLTIDETTDLSEYLPDPDQVPEEVGEPAEPLYGEWVVESDD